MGIEESMCAHTFYMAINRASRMHLDGSTGGSFLELTAKAGMDLLAKIVENEAMHKHWEEFQEQSLVSREPLIDKIRGDEEKTIENSAPRVGSTEVQELNEGDSGQGLRKCRSTYQPC